MKDFESAGLTDIGKKRSVNQDSFWVDDVNGLYVVADGIGGRPAGDVASRMTVQIVGNGFALQDPLPVAPQRDASLSKEARRLIQAIGKANEKVFIEASDNDAFKGMGSTVSAVCLLEKPSIGKTLIGANVGDSPIYLVRHGNIEMLSMPHTIIAEVAAPNSKGNATADPIMKQMLTRAVGINASVEADTFEIQCYEGDIIVICSDGLSNKVESKEISTVVSTYSPKEACRNLVDLANQRGGEDNITVVVVKVASMQRGLGWFFNRITQFFNPQKQEAKNAEHIVEI